MVRTTLLGLLIAGVTLIALADTTPATNTKMSILAAQAKTAQAKTPCTSLDLSGYCPPTTISHQPKIHSDLWLKEIAKVLLSGSMFPICLERSALQERVAQSPKSLGYNQFPSVSYAQSPWDRLTNTNNGCTFSWQKSHSQEFKGLNTIQSPKFLSGQNFPTSTISLTETPAFPKLSRSSLIVSFPSQDSSFIPKDKKLANPAPATKRIASPFGWRRRPYSNQLQFHQGIDYGAPLGSPVVAVNNGIVTTVVSGCADFSNLFCGGQLGNWIEIDHGDGAIATYGHLKNSSIVVKEGMKVRKNQEIAQVGSSGWSTGAHLDFRFKVNGKHENPAKYVTAINKTNIKSIH